MSAELVPHPPAGGVLALPEQQQARILQALSLDMKQPLTQALLLVAERYDLDPLLKQVQIIKGSVYITHAGLLHIAHASGQLDGIVVEEEGSDKDSYFAKVSVYRKDMGKPFTYQGEYRKSKVRADGASGREMALKNAERSALRRAFDISAPTMDDSGDDFDTVMPMGDIDLPADRPPLPTLVADIPTPEPPRPELPPPGVDPETGEVAATPAKDMEGAQRTDELAEASAALKKRAAEIVEKAETAPAKPVKRVAKKTAPPKDARVARAQSLHMAAKEQDLEEPLLRDIVRAVTDGRTDSTKEVDEPEAELIRSLIVAYGQELLDPEYDADGDLIIDPVANDLAPDDAIEDAEVVTPKDWKHEANVRNIRDGIFLRKARAIAEELNVPLPPSIKDIQGAELESALWAWLQEVTE